MAVIQKMDSDKGFFGSPTYQVPLDHLFLCSINSTGHSPSFDFSDSDQDEINDAAITKNYLVSCSSDNSDYEMIIPGTGNDAQLEQENIIQSEIGTPHMLQRPARNRRKPDRYGSTSYDCDAPFSGENDTVQNYWPNYPRGTWSADNTNE